MRRLPFIIACALAVLAPSTRGGEDVPRDASVSNAAKRPLEQYVRESRGAMGDLVRLIQSGNESQREWVKICSGMRKTLANNYRDAISQHQKDTGQDNLPPAFVQWFNGESEGWGNFLSLGSQFAVEHDFLLEQIELIEDEELPRVTSMVKSLGAMSTGINNAFSLLVKTIAAAAEAKGLTGASEVASAVTSFNGTLSSAGEQSVAVAVLIKLLVKQSDAVEMFRKSHDPDDYESKIKKFIGRRVSPDKGPWWSVKESQLERELLDWLDKYERTYRKYEAETKPVLEQKLLTSYEYLKSMTYAQVLPKYKSLVSKLKGEIKELEDHQKDLEDKLEDQDEAR
ncbi:MAG: hypothetical protein H6834_09990 [Planctomycetes bacterium]|nr:hypothetical protein [Planctomycetota bacterium]